MGHEHIHIAGEHLGRQARQMIHLVFRPARFNHQVLTFDITELSQTIKEGLHIRGGGRSRARPDNTQPHSLGGVRRADAEYDSATYDAERQDERYETSAHGVTSAKRSKPHKIDPLLLVTSNDPVQRAATGGEAGC
jgi:hypothetical protein